MTHIFDTPIAENGTTIDVPVQASPDGWVSLEEGFTEDYELPYPAVPGAKPVERWEINSLFKLVSEALGELQQHGYSVWQAREWPEGSRVVHAGTMYQCSADTEAEPPSAPWVAEDGALLVGTEGTDTVPYRWSAKQLRAITEAWFELVSDAKGRDVLLSGTAEDARSTLELGTAATANLTTSNLDGTAGRVLKVNDFGIGEGGLVLLDFSDITIPNGFYRWAIGTINRPAAISEAYGTMLVTGGITGASSHRGRILIGLNSDRMWLQRSVNGAPWTDPVELYHTGNLLNIGTTPVSARSALELGTAATANLTTSTTDGTTGRVLKVGDGGFLSQAGDVDANATGLSTRFLRFNENGPRPNPVHWHGLHISRVNNQQGAQLAISDGYSTSPIIAGIRVRGANGVWSEWRELHHTGNILQTTGTSTNLPMSQKAVSDLLASIMPGQQSSMTGICTTNGTTNNTVQLTSIGTYLSLEAGDVIRIQYSGYDKLHTVESITGANSIIVNYEHAGNRGNGSLKLADQTATVTITRIAKWFNAPLGLGQAWLSVRGTRSLATNYTSAPGRAMGLFVPAATNEGSEPILVVDGVQINMNGPGSVAQYLTPISITLPSASSYQIIGGWSFENWDWWELR